MLLSLVINAVPINAVPIFVEHCLMPGSSCRIETDYTLQQLIGRRGSWQALQSVTALYCRENYGDYFGITVAGYPEAHPEVITDDADEMDRAYQSDLQYLKKKVGQNCAVCSILATQSVQHDSVSCRASQVRDRTLQAVFVCMKLKSLLA